MNKLTADEITHVRKPRGHRNNKTMTAEKETRHRNNELGE